MRKVFPINGLLVLSPSSPDNALGIYGDHTAILVMAVRSPA